MSLFGNLYVGTSGLQASQEALNVVAHNVTNADTVGYVRQQVSYNTKEYSKLDSNASGIAQKQTGLGVYIAEVRQVRDRFVDASYRNQYGRQGFYDVSFDAMEEVQEVMGELDGPIFYNSLNNIWTAIEELAKDPDSEVCQSMLIQYAQSFAEAAHNCYSDLSDYQDKLNGKVNDMVDRINKLGKRIFELNTTIRGIEAGGIENANDYKDALNQALDELANLGNISYSTDYYGNVLVKFENHDFVTMNTVIEIGVMPDEENAGFYKVFWPDSAEQKKDEWGKVIRDRDGNATFLPDSAPVFIMPPDSVISAARNTDVGTLKGVLLARGDHRGSYTDLEGVMRVTDVATGNNKYISYTEAELKQMTAGCTKEETRSGVLRYTSADGSTVYTLKTPGDKRLMTPEEKYSYVQDSVMMNTMAEFDGLVHSVVTAVNQALIDAAVKAKTEAAANGSVSGYMRVGGKYDGEPLLIFERTSTDPEFIAGTDELTPEDPTDSHTWFSCRNLCVNKDLLQYPTHLGMVKEDGSVDYETAASFRNAFTDAKYVINPTLTNLISIQDYYSGYMAQIANTGNVYKSLKENQELSVKQIENTRQGGIGVSTDEELSNMIKFQNAYNANSRFINVIDECTEHIITSLGHA